VKYLNTVYRFQFELIHTNFVHIAGIIMNVCSGGGADNVYNHVKRYNT